VLSISGATELAADLEIERRVVRLKGVAGGVTVHSLRGV
jgi:hypothetical protein